MKLNRRGFLQLIPPALLLPGTAGRATAQAAEDALFLLIDGIGPDTPADGLDAFIAPFLAGEIPVALVLRAPGPADTALPPPLVDGLRRVLASGKTRVEPVLSLPGLADLPAYFQRRTTSDALHWFAEVAAGTGQPPPLSVATDAEAPANYDALRCLGIRSVIADTSADQVTSSGCATLSVCLTGASSVAIADTADPAAVIRAALSRPGWTQIALSLAEIGQTSLADLRVRGQRAADAIAAGLERGRHFLALPRDHALWFGEDQARLVALAVDLSAPAEPTARDALVAGLRALALPYSAVLPAPNGPDGSCHPLPPAAADPSLPTGLLCPSPPALAGTPDLRVGPTPGAAFDVTGLLSRGETPLPEAGQLLDSADLMRDAILILRPDDIGAAEELSATLATLRRLQADTSSTLVDLPTFLRQTTAPDPVFDLVRASSRDPVEPPDPAPLTAEDWLEDARLAWTFFERFSTPATGLCVDTADVQGQDEWLHRELTMWDLGSLISAVMAAHELGLLPDAAFIDRAEKLVRALPATKIAGLILPSAVISSETGTPLSRDFNACDTGRLLSVLRELDAHPLTPGIAARRIADWDLAGVIVDGHVHSLVDGALVDRFRSHCAHYTARAFRDRGFAVASPYETAETMSGTDRAMMLLHSLRGFGPLGAEPLLFEALEMGLSPPSDLLASVLFTAQKRDHARTGALYCVSEAPLNVEPWFTYQGLDLTGAEDRWMVSAASNDPRFMSEAFRNGTALVNTKAAYLWAACRPGPYATLVTRHVRTRARLDGMGFSPGVFVATGEGMPGYADINTNAVVLAAIAFIRRGRKPRLAAR